MPFDERSESFSAVATFTVAFFETPACRFIQDVFSFGLKIRGKAGYGIVGQIGTRPCVNGDVETESTYDFSGDFRFELSVSCRNYDGLDGVSGFLVRKKIDQGADVIIQQIGDDDLIVRPGCEDGIRSSECGEGDEDGDADSMRFQDKALPNGGHVRESHSSLIG